MQTIIARLRKFANWLLPHICVSCHLNCDINTNSDLCPVCIQYLPWMNSYCYRCGAGLVTQQESLVCKRCLDNPPPFNRLCVLFAYQQPIIKLINQLKFGQKLFVGKIFGQLLATAVKYNWYKHNDLPQLIIPVPLHQKRQRQRGYNQAVEIATTVAKQLHIPLGINMCIRVINTKPQALLDKEQRYLNVKNAFIANIPSIYKHVVIIDDVCTTGNTLRNLSRALVLNGVETIDVWCIARA